MELPNRQLRGYLLVMVAAVLWATLGLFYRVLSEQYGLATGVIVTYRAGIAALALFVALGLLSPRSLRVRRRDWPYFGLFGSVGVAAFFLCYVRATTAGPLAVAAVLLYTAPIWITIWAVLRQGETLTTRKLIALLLAFGGCALVANVFDPANLAINGAALLFGLLSGLGYAAYSLWSAEGTRRGYSAWTVVAYALGIGALISWLLFRERLSWGVWLGVLLTVGGSALVGFSDGAGGSGSNPLLGDLLALLGAMTVTGYFLVGRNLRARLSLLPYIWLVYSSAGVVLLLWMALAGQTLLGLPPLVYLLLLGLAIGPQLLGHTAFNWAIKYLSATFVTVAILGEPIGATIIAVLVLDEQLQPLQLLGGVLLLLGIGVATLAERQRPQTAVEIAEVEATVAP
jgi:drug/metabolite transporter (DMT)-like permease